MESLGLHELGLNEGRSLEVSSPRIELAARQLGAEFRVARLEDPWRPIEPVGIVPRFARSERRR
jgi:hypothetical protein